MVYGKGVQYYLSEKGLKFDFNNPRYIQEEKEIIDILKDGRLNVNKIMELVNNGLGIKRGWGYINSKIEGLRKEGLIIMYSQDDECHLSS